MPKSVLIFGVTHTVHFRAFHLLTNKLR